MISESGRSAGEGIDYPLQYSWASLVAQLVMNPPTMRETWVRFLGWEDPLEKGKTTHSSILAWRIPWTIQSMGSQRVGHDSDFHFHLFTVHLQYQVQGLGLNEYVIFLSVTLFVGILEVSIEDMFLQKVFSLFLLSVFEFLPGWHFFFFF